MATKAMVKRASSKKAVASFVQDMSGRLLINNQSLIDFAKKCPNIGKILAAKTSVEQEFNTTIELSGRIRVLGGGFTSQTRALTAVIAKMIAEESPEYKKFLKSQGLTKCLNKPKNQNNLGRDGCARARGQRNKR